MKTRELVFIVPLLALAILSYFLGHRQGARSQKVTDEMHLIRIAVRNLDDAESGDTEMIKKMALTEGQRARSAELRWAERAWTSLRFRFEGFQIANLPLRLQVDGIFAPNEHDIHLDRVKVEV